MTFVCYTSPVLEMKVPRVMSVRLSVSCLFISYDETFTSFPGPLKMSIDVSLCLIGNRCLNSRYKNPLWIF